MRSVGYLLSLYIVYLLTMSTLCSTLSPNISFLYHCLFPFLVSISKSAYFLYLLGYLPTLPTLFSATYQYIFFYHCFPSLSPFENLLTFSIYLAIYLFFLLSFLYYSLIGYLFLTCLLSQISLRLITYFLYIL